MRVGGDTGTPVVAGDASDPAAQALTALASRVAKAGASRSGVSLGLQPSR
jgi:ATP-binding protein involved in chromosome partitioning